MQTVKEYVSNYYQQYQSELDLAYPGLKLERLLEAFLQYSHKKSFESYQESETHFFDLLAEEIPLEYIRKESFFYRSEFYVNENVLIPRSETEILVEDSLAFINNNIKKKKTSSFKVAEIGVGSFALGLSILIDLDQDIFFWGGDISKEALEVSRMNYFRVNSRINPNSVVKLELSDRLKETDEKFNLIVSNPPYIKESAKKSVHKNVENFEPHVALYLADEEYDQWFKDFFHSSNEHLVEGGAFYMEGHEDTLKDLKTIASSIFNEVLIKKDYTGRDRFLHCY